MSLFQNLFLGLLQGLTEFLPVSSSGHLNLFQFIFGLRPSLSWDVFLNTATLFSVLFFFRKKIPFFIAHLPQIVLASLPAALMGIFFKDSFEHIFSQFSLLALFFLINSLILFSTKNHHAGTHQITYRQAFIIGLAQALAILPGISRAGTTIAAALALGISAKSAFNFSFSLFIPASLGALLLSLRDSDFHSYFKLENLLVFIFTFLVGVLALNFLQKVLSRGRLWYFAFYTLFLSLSTFTFYLLTVQRPL